MMQQLPMMQPMVQPGPVMQAGFGQPTVEDLMAQGWQPAGLPSFPPGQPQPVMQPGVPMPFPGMPPPMPPPQQQKPTAQQWADFQRRRNASVKKTGFTTRESAKQTYTAPPGIESSAAAAYLQSIGAPQQHPPVVGMQQPQPGFPQQQPQQQQPLAPTVGPPTVGAFGQPPSAAAVPQPVSYDPNDAYAQMIATYANAPQHAAGVPAAPRVEFPQVVPVGGLPVGAGSIEYQPLPLPTSSPSATHYGYLPPGSPPQIAPNNGVPYAF